MSDLGGSPEAGAEKSVTSSQGVDPYGYYAQGIPMLLWGPLVGTFAYNFKHMKSRLQVDKRSRQNQRTQQDQRIRFHHSLLEVWRRRMMRTSPVPNQAPFLQKHHLPANQSEEIKNAVSNIDYVFEDHVVEYLSLKNR
jgi:hypothetical protein